MSTVRRARAGKLQAHAPARTPGSRGQRERARFRQADATDAPAVGAHGAIRLGRIRANAALADVVRAGIAVVADDRDILAAVNGITGVDRTGVIVVTIQRCSRDTAARGVARFKTVANIPVVAIQRRARLAPRGRITGLNAIADVVVIALGRCVEAPCCRIASVSRASIVVVAVERLMLASTCWIASVDRAFVAIVTVEFANFGDGRTPCCRIALWIFGTGISVVAIDHVMEARTCGAIIIGAFVAVVAVQQVMLYN